MLKHAVRLNSLTEIALTKLDVLDTFDEVKVCVGYRKNGETITSYPDRSEELAAVEAVYETLPGWKTDTVGVQSFDKLPTAAQKLVSIVERETGVPVTFIGTGPARDAVVRR
jgi:adenylosuccinate synthase